MKFKLLSIAALAVMFTGAFAQGPKATADEMIAAIKAVKMPAVDQSKVNDRAYVQQYIKDRNEAMKQQADLILAFYKEYPTHEQAPALMNQRWGTLMMSADGKTAFKAGIDETEMVLKNAPSTDMEKNATYWWSNFKMQDVAPNAKEMLAAADRFATKWKDDARGFDLLNSVAYQTANLTDRVAIYKRLIADYPTNRSIKYMPGKVRQIEGMGKPFDLKFDDAISGKKVDVLKDFQGKVVVIDFWATWCGPCVADLPHVRDIYKKYHDQGVEYVSVSLDQPVDKGGLDKLKEFVGKNDMPWNHYYQGNFWQSEFSTSWGINAIPCLFILDQKGNLYDVEGRARLEEQIKKLLGK